MKGGKKEEREETPGTAPGHFFFLEHLHTCSRRGEKNRSGRTSMGAPEAPPVPTFSSLPLAVAWSPLSLALPL